MSRSRRGAATFNRGVQGQYAMQEQGAMLNLRVCGAPSPHGLLARHHGRRHLRAWRSAPSAHYGRTIRSFSGSPALRMAMAKSSTLMSYRTPTTIFLPIRKFSLTFFKNILIQLYGYICCSNLRHVRRH